MAKTVNLAEVVPGYNSGATEFIVEDKAQGKVEVMSREDLSSMTPENIGTVVPKPFQGSIVDGADEIVEHFLHKEFPYMMQFFQAHGLPNPQITYEFETAGEYWLKVDFPLPQQVTLDNGEVYTYPYDRESFLFVLNSYPAGPPIGFHVPKESRNIKVMEKIFKTHMYDSAVLENSHVSDSLEENWHWICFHHDNHSWQFNRNNIREGDSLSYFFYYIYYKLAGLEGVSHE